MIKRTRFPRLADDRGASTAESIVYIGVILAATALVGTLAAFLIGVGVNNQQADQTVGRALTLQTQWNRDVHQAAAVVGESDKIMDAYVPSSVSGCTKTQWAVQATKVVRTVTVYPSFTGADSTFRCAGTSSSTTALTLVAGNASASTITFTNAAGRDMTFSAAATATLASATMPTNIDSSDWNLAVVKKAALNYKSPPTIFGGSRLFTDAAYVRATSTAYQSSNPNMQPFAYPIATPAAPVVNPTNPKFLDNYTVTWTGVCPSGTNFLGYEATQNGNGWTGVTSATSQTLTAPTDTTPIVFRVRVLCSDAGASAASAWSDPGTATPVRPAATAPSGVGVSVGFSGDTGVIVATGSCARGLTPLYNLRAVLNDGDQGWGGEGSGTSRNVAGTYEGYKLRGDVQMRCFNGVDYSPIVSASNEQVRGVSNPVNVGTSLDVIPTDVARANGWSNCATGTTATYDFRMIVNGGDYGYGGRSANPNRLFGGFYQGYNIAWENLAQCQGAYASSGFVSVGGNYTRPIDTPAAPANPSTNSNGSAAFNDDRIVWNRTSCPTGTSDQYRAIRIRDDSGSNSGGLASTAWGTPSLTGSNVYYDVSTKASVGYTWQMAARCATSYTTSGESAWSASANWRTEFPISTPAAPTASDTSPNTGDTVTIRWTNDACPSTTSDNGYQVYADGGSWVSGTDGAKSATVSRGSAGSYTFTVRIRCVSADGDTAWSNWSSGRKVTWTTPSPPSDPTGVSASGFVRYCSNAGWIGTPSWNAMARAASYTVQAQWTTKTGTVTTWRDAGSTTGTSMQINVQASTANSPAIKIRVMANGANASIGSSGWTTVSASTTAGCS